MPASVTQRLCSEGNGQGLFSLEDELDQDAVGTLAVSGVSYRPRVPFTPCRNRREPGTQELGVKSSKGWCLAVRIASWRALEPAPRSLADRVAKSCRRCLPRRLLHGRKGGEKEAQLDEGAGPLAGVVAEERLLPKEPTEAGNPGPGHST